MNKIIKNCYFYLVYAFLYFPLLVVVIFSFNKAKLSLIWHGFSTHWYVVLAHDSSMIQVAINSLILATTAATIACIIGSIAACSLFRYQFLGKQILHGLIFILIVIPDIVMAIALLLLYNFFHLKLGFTSLLLAHISFCMPFVSVVVYSRIKSLDKNIIEAAKDLGADEFQIFYQILIPILFPAILAAWLLSFTLSLDDVIISYFVSGPGFEILPLKIFSMVRLGVDPEINALCAILLCLTFIIVISAQFFLRKKS